MGSLFDPNGGIMGFMGKVFDVIVLSLIWFIFSLPIITIGASTTALYYTSVKAIRRERGYIFKTFWHSFRTNFLNATIIWVPYAFFMGMLVFNIKFALSWGGNKGFALLCVYCMLAFLLICAGTYMFPILSRFSMKRMQIVKTSLLIAVRHFPITVILVVIVVITILGFYIIPMSVLFLPAVSTLLFSLLMEPIMKKYTPKSEGDQPKDEWYLE